MISRTEPAVFGRPSSPLTRVSLSPVLYVYIPKASADDLKKTINYQAIYKIAKDTFENYKFKLIETVAQKIASKILNINGISNVLIRVRKPHVPLNGLLDFVEIEIYRER